MEGRSSCDAAAGVTTLAGSQELAPPLSKTSGAFAALRYYLSR
jgi:hypothetical protein